EPSRQGGASNCRRPSRRAEQGVASQPLPHREEFGDEGVLRPATPPVQQRGPSEQSKVQRRVQHTNGPREGHTSQEPGTHPSVRTQQSTGGKAPQPSAEQQRPDRAG